MKILLVLAALTGAAQAQSRTFYDASGKVTGRSSTSSSGAVTNYDAQVRVVSRQSTSGIGRQSMTRADAMSDGPRRTARA